MKKEARIGFVFGGALLILFAVWTVLVCTVDVGAIGPRGSGVGFAGMNGWFHGLTGVHMWLYELTDLFSVLPLGFILAFGVVGLVQMVTRRSIFKVDRDILALGVFYVMVMAAFVGFEIMEINYRPILIDGVLEASYPSSTTMLVMCVMPTAIMQLGARIRCDWVKKLVKCILVSFTVFMVIGRMISGVHWLSDIIGGALLSGGLVMLYYGACRMMER